VNQTSLCFQIDDFRDVLLHEPVSTLDGLRILVETKPQDFKHGKPIASRVTSLTTDAICKLVG